MRKLKLALTATLLAGLALLTGMGCTEKKSISIKGSDTMVHLVSEWAEAYMKNHTDVEITVTGGGSGTGIAALLNKTTDICASSRDIKPKEIEMAEKRKVKPVEHVVARDGIAVVVHPENPVNVLEIEQIGKIYTGAITNWKQVEGPDQKITVLSRESSSGTYVYFQERVLNKKDYAPKTRLMPATSSIVSSVAEDKWSIGYVGLGYADKAGDKIKVLQVKENTDSPAVTPSGETIGDGNYGIARPLFLYTSGEPMGAVKDFIAFAKDAAGQKIVEEAGYVTVK